MNIFKGIVPKTISLSLIIYAAVYLFYLNNKLDYPFVKAFYTAGLIALFNFLGGWLAIKYSQAQSFNFFLIILFGGMITRLFVMLVLVFISLRFLDIKTDVFIFVLFVFYFFYLIIEIFTLFKEKKGTKITQL